MSAHDADSYNSDLLLKGNLGWITLLVKSTPNSPHKRILGFKGDTSVSGLNTKCLAFSLKLLGVATITLW